MQFADSMQMTASAELMVEHVANYLKKDPVAVKLANMYKIGQTDMDQIPISLDFQQIYQSIFSLPHTNVVYELIVSSLTL